MTSMVATVTTSHSDVDTVEKDIDGVPLRDSKKIDLKQILGHCPDVDYEEEDNGAKGDSSKQVTYDELTLMSLGLCDDDDEFEYGYEDEEEEKPKRRPVQRRSSLKTISLELKPDSSDDDPTTPTSPHKKAVRFADAIGLGLEDIRDLINADEPPEVPHSALKDLKIRKKRSKTGGRFRLSLSFSQPAGDAWFLKRVTDDKVALENCIVCDRELTVSGIVRVANVAFQKRVYIRYTTDFWKSTTDLTTVYLPSSNDGVTDRFMFSIHLSDGFGPDGCSSEDKRSSELEFAICYQAGADSFWDNNRGSNYVVTCVLCSCESPSSAEEESV